MNEEIQTLIKETIESDQFPKISNDHRRNVTEQLLSNQIKFMKGIVESEAPTNATGAAVANFDPVLIKMVRRSMPQLMAFDLMGVQPMSAPTGSIFAMRARYASQTGAEAGFNEANSGFSGAGTQAGDTSGFPKGFFVPDDAGTAGVDESDPAVSTSYGTGMSTAAMEALGVDNGTAWNEMAFSIERVDVSAKGRKLKAKFSRELQYDLKNVHGLDAETELGNILAEEIRAEIDRECLRTINVAAKVGAQKATKAGLFDMTADSDGRWLVERFKGLLFQLEIEANAVAKATRRGKANRVICSSNVASALNMAGVLEYNPALAANLNVDEASATFAGVLLGRYQVFVDPYATVDYITVGYKGGNAWDAGVYFCPYLPLEMYRTTGEDNFQPAIGFSTRYGIIANPFDHNYLNAGVATPQAGKGLGQGENSYFRKFAVGSLTI